MLTIVTVLACLGALLLLLRPQLLASDSWRATATPLASIIGSGFLVSVPILRDVVGEYAVLAMIGLLAVAYLIGGAIRDNIQYVEPRVQNGDAAVPVTATERISHLALSFAYFVSIAYYLVLWACRRLCAAHASVCRDRCLRHASGRRLTANSPRRGRGTLPRPGAIQPIFSLSLQPLAKKAVAASP
jgi:hypothetical protein